MDDWWYRRRFAKSAFSSFNWFDRKSTPGQDGVTTICSYSCIRLLLNRKEGVSIFVKKRCIFISYLILLSRKIFLILVRNKLTLFCVTAFDYTKILFMFFLPKTSKNDATNPHEQTELRGQARLHRRISSSNIKPYQKYNGNEENCIIWIDQQHDEHFDDGAEQRGPPITEYRIPIFGLRMNGNGGDRLSNWILFGGGRFIFIWCDGGGGDGVMAGATEYDTIWVGGIVDHHWGFGGGRRCWWK